MGEMTGVRLPAGAGLFPSPPRPNQLWSPRNCVSNGYWGLFRSKTAGSHIDHSPQSSAEVKNAWSYTSTPHVFMTWCFVKHRVKFTLIGLKGCQTVVSSARKCLTFFQPPIYKATHTHRRVYPKVSGLAAWSENCK